MRGYAPVPGIAAILTLLLSAGCANNPAAPTSGVGQPSSTSQNLTDALSVTEFSLQGWQDNLFHYLARLSVSVPATGDTVYVQRVDFTTSNSGATTRLAGIAFGSPQRVVSPGGTLDLFKGIPPVEVTSPVGLASITATVFFTNGVGQTGSLTVTRDLSPLPPSASSAALVIQSFSVVGSSEGGSFSYWPKLTLTETSGVSHALIKKMTFELLDVGPSGRVPPSWEPREVPAGGSITLDEDEYGYGPWLEITSMADASRVSLTISFVDDAGRGGSVTAVVPVSR
jgi:hypothetical protein